MDTYQTILVTTETQPIARDISIYLSASNSVLLYDTPHIIELATLKGELPVSFLCRFLNKKLNKKEVNLLREKLSISVTEMFTVPLYDDEGVITYYISSGWVDEQFLVLWSDPAILYEACSEVATLEQCTAVINQSIVTTEDPHVLIESMGLSLQSPEILQYLTVGE